MLASVIEKKEFVSVFEQDYYSSNTSIWFADSPYIKYIHRSHYGYIYSVAR